MIMCLSIPGTILKIDGNMAEVDIAGNTCTAGTHLTEGLNPGDRVLVHSGFIIQKLSPDEAAETETLLREILGSEEN